MVSTDLLLTFAVNGVVLGSILALAAIGLTLVYGILNLSNFAHGDYVTLGAYAAFYFNVTLVATTGGMMATVWSAVAVALALAAAALVDARWKRRLDGAERAIAIGAAVALLLVALAQGFGRGLGLPRFLTSGMLLPAAMAVVLVPVVAVLLELLVWRPLRRKRATVLTFVIVSIGVALALRYLLVMYFGGGLRTYNRLPSLPFFLGDIVVTKVQAIIVVMAALLIVAIHLILRHTRVGKALRALADNMDLARASGIDVDRMVIYVWVLAGALAAVAGVLLAMNTNVNPNLGWNLLLPIFAAVILGGIGSAYGAMVGALVIGVAMEMSVAFHPNYRFAVAFLTLIAVLLVRPQGILGGKV